MRQPYNTPLPNTQLQHQPQHIPPNSARSVRSTMSTRSVKPVSMKEEFSLRAFEVWYVDFVFLGGFCCH